MLWEEKQENVVELVREVIPDGSGGSDVVWTIGESFTAAITQDDAENTDIGQKAEPTSTWSITTEHEIYFHEVIKTAEGKYYRIINEPDHTPPYATFQWYQARAEKWGEDE